MVTVPQWRTLIVALVILLSGVTTGVSATPAASPTQTNETNTSVPSHVDPMTIQVKGDSQQIADRLTAQLGRQLTNGVIALSEQNYTRAEQPLAASYTKNLSRYGLVAADVDEAALVEEFNLTRTHQRELVESVREAETLATAYQEALTADDEAAAQNASRELLAVAAEVNQTANTLDQQYDVLANETDLSLTEARVALTEVQLITQQATAELRDREFTRTNLTVSVNRTQIATTRPVQVRGQLVTATREPLSDKTIRLQFGGEQITTQTTSAGRFEVTYRPVVATMSATTLRVSYTPDAGAPYLPTAATVPVTISSQTPAQIRLETQPSTIRYGETVTTTARVIIPAVDTASKTDVPLVLRLADQRLATATTTTDGQATLTPSLPGTIPAGTSPLAVAVARSNLAIAPTETTSTVRIQTTPTTVTAEASSGDNATVVSGRLETASGAGLSGYPIVISQGDQQLTTATTGTDGTFETPVTPPATTMFGQVGGEATVAFRATGTNLEASETTIIITPRGQSQPPAEEPAAWMLPVSPWLLGGILGVGGLLLLLAIIARRRGWRIRTPAPAREATADSRDQTASHSSTSTTKTESIDSHVSTSLGTRIWELLFVGLPDRAIQLGYVVVRNRVGRSIGVQHAATHREFAARVRNTASVWATTLDTLTDAYEQAAYAPGTLSGETTDKAITLITEVLSRGGDSTRQREGDDTPRAAGGADRDN